MKSFESYFTTSFEKTPNPDIFFDLLWSFHDILRYLVDKHHHKGDDHHLANHHRRCTHTLQALAKQLQSPKDRLVSRLAAV